MLISVSSILRHGAIERMIRSGNCATLRWIFAYVIFFSSRRRHTRYWRDWSSDGVLFRSSPQIILCPRLHVGRSGPHHHFRILAFGIMSGIIYVVQIVLFVINSAACTERSVLFHGGSGRRKDLAHGLIVGSILGGYTPDRVIIVGGIVVIFLQVEHFELPTLLIVEGHRDRKSTRLNSSHANISYAVF